MERVDTEHGGSHGNHSHGSKALRTSVFNTTQPVNKEERKKKHKDQPNMILGADIQIRIDKINKEYDKVKTDSSKAKVHFLDRIKQQIMNSKKK